MSEFQITGRPTGGLGWGSTTVKLQLPRLKPFFPEIEKCHPATINLKLDGNLRIEKPDIETPPLDWSVQWERRLPPERFWLTRFEFEISGKTERIEAWLYDAEFSPHRPKTWFVEFLAPFTPYDSDDIFTLYFDRDAREERLTYLT